jgi:hypothetical protein
VRRNSSSVVSHAGEAGEAAVRQPCLLATRRPEPHERRCGHRSRLGVIETDRAIGSQADGTPVSLSDTLTSIDQHNIQLLIKAIHRASPETGQSILANQRNREPGPTAITQDAVHAPRVQASCLLLPSVRSQ